MAISTATLIFRLEKEKRDEFMRLCESNGLSPSEVLRVMIDYVLRTKKVPTVSKKKRSRKNGPDAKEQEQIKELKDLFSSMDL